MRSFRPSRSWFRIVRGHEIPLFVGLIISWMALWRTVSLLSLTSGAIAAIITMRLYYLPPVQLGGRLNVLWAARYLVYFLWHLAIASFQVAALALRPGKTPQTAILEVRLITHSDFIMTMVALTVSLIPGSLVVETDRLSSTLYLHVLNTPTERYISKMRAQVLHIETLLIRAIGDRNELEKVQA